MKKKFNLLDFTFLQQCLSPIVIIAILILMNIEGCQ
jgi:hypothetical protein